MQPKAPTDTAKCWTHKEALALIHEIITDLAPASGTCVPRTRLIEELGYHSLSLLELAFSLEDEFDLPTIEEAAARQILTVKDVEQHVFKHLESTGLLSSPETASA